MASEATVDYEEVARDLQQAWETRVRSLPSSRKFGIASIEEAYAVQLAWTRLRQSRGERILGRKIGLTSKAMQEQAGFDRPDFGSLWESRYVDATDGLAEIAAETFIQPRIEGEIAFRLGTRLAGPGVTVEQVLKATEALASSFEVVDSRYERVDFKVLDTIADNASYGAFTLGPWDRDLLRHDLRELRMTIRKNGETVVEGTGADSLGHPANAVAWLANTLAEFDVELRAGDIVLSGSMGKAVPVQRGDEFVMELTSQPPLTLVFT